MLTNDLTLFILTDKHLENFYKNIKPGATITYAGEPCHEWVGYKNKTGYGTIEIRGKTRFAHRVAYAIANYRIPNDLLVCHHCDNPSCVNPKHLFAGTHTDNMRDKVKKGRQAKGPALRGRAKLSVEDIPVIFALRAKGNTLKEIAYVMKIGITQVWDILEGNYWKE